MNNIMMDFRHAFVRLRREKHFTAAFVATLSIVLAFTFSVMALVDNALIKPLPYPKAESIVAIETAVHLPDATMNGNSPGISREIIETSPLLDLTALHILDQRTTVDRSGKTSLPVGYVTPSYFEMLSFEFQHGSAFQDDFVPGKKNLVAVVSESFAQSELRKSPIKVGDQIQLNEEFFRVVGIVQDIDTPWNLSEKPINVWLPTSASGKNFYKIPEFGSEMSLLAIPKNSDLAVLNEQLNKEMKDIGRKGLPPFIQIDGKATLLKDLIVKDSKNIILGIGLCAIFFVVLTMVNLASLYIANAAKAKHQMLIRQALGATQNDVARLLFSEILLLTLFSSVIAILLSAGLLNGFKHFSSDFLAGANTLGLDAGLIAAYLITSVLICLTFQLSVMKTLRVNNIYSSLNTATKGAGALLSSRTRNAIVFCQVMLGTLLLIIFVKFSFEFNKRVLMEPSFALEDVYQIEVKAREADSAKPGYMNNLVSSIQQILIDQGIKHSAFTNQRPLDTGIFTTDVKDLQGHFLSQVNPIAVSDSYQSVAGLTLIDGEFFSENDRLNAAAKVIISQSLAGYLFPDGNGLGQFVEITALEKDFEIIGVMEDIQNPGLMDTAGVASAMNNQAYVPYNADEKQSNTQEDVVILFRSNGDTEQQASLRSTIDERHPELLNITLTSLDNEYAEIRAPYVVGSVLFNSLLLITLVISFSGLYGLTKFNVHAKSRELGLKLSLGASDKALIVDSVTQYSNPVIYGLVFGLLTTVLLSMLGFNFASKAVLIEPSIIMTTALLTMVTSLLSIVLPTVQILSNNKNIKSLLESN